MQPVCAGDQVSQARSVFRPVLLGGCLLLAACQGNLGKGDSADVDAGQMPELDASSPPDAAAPLEPIDAGSPPDPYQVCSADGWCFEAPYPAAEDIQGVAQVSSDLTLLVGKRGRIVQLEAGGLRGVASGSDADLFAVRAFAANDAWAVGDLSTFLHFDGEAWTPYHMDGDAGGLPSDDLRALWGPSGTDIWAVGALGALWHYDGASWIKQTSVTGKGLHGVWGVSPSQIYAVGDDATLLTYDGNQWQPSTLPGGGRALGIHGTAADDLWVVGENGKVWHFDGSAWTALETPPGPEHLRALFARAKDELYVVGDGGRLSKYDGTAWQDLTVGSEEPLFAVEHAGDALLAVGAHGLVAQFVGTERTLLSRGGRDNYLDLSAGGASAPWVVGDATLRLQAGGITPTESGTTHALYGCFALSDELAWAVGTGGTIVRWDGGSMLPTESGTERWLRAIWAASPQTVWIVGEQGTVLGLFNGTSWVPSTVPSREDLFDVWGAAPDDVWVTGDKGVLLHWNGLDWSLQDPGSTVRLQTVWGASADDVYVAGANGTVLHWNGKAWQAQQEGASYTLYGLGGEHGAVYAVGSSGTILRSPGAGEPFVLERTPTDVTLFGIGRGADGALRAVGADGVVLIHRTH